MADKTANLIISAKGRVAFPTLFKPRSYRKGNRPRFSIILIYGSDDDLGAMKQACADAAVTRWGSNMPANIRNPFRSNAERSAYSGFEDSDGKFIQPWSYQEPTVLVQRAGKRVRLEEETRDGVYAGCYAVVSMKPFAYDEPSPGVGLQLWNVLKVADGDRLAGSTGEEFKGVEVEDAAVTEEDGAGQEFGGSASHLFD